MSNIVVVDETVYRRCIELYTAKSNRIVNVMPQKMAGNQNNEKEKEKKKLVTKMENKTHYNIGEGQIPSKKCDQYIFI